MTDTTAVPSTDTTTDSATSEDDLVRLVDGYFACWNAVEPGERSEAVARTWAPDARSVDPVADAHGHDELTAMFAGFHDTYPGHSFRRRGGIDHHHEMLRWGWEMIDPHGDVVLDGIDAAMIADGRLGYVVGFFGCDLPAG